MTAPEKALVEVMGLVALAERLDRNAASHHERADAYLSLNNARAAAYAFVRDYGEKLRDGYVLVPREPTERMTCDGFESEPDEIFSPPEEWAKYEAMTGCEAAHFRARLCWIAMIRRHEKDSAPPESTEGRDG